MSNWNFFPLPDERPEGVKKYSEAERLDLERRVASQVSTLLRLYGQFNVVEVDQSECIDVEESRSFRILELDDLVFVDGSILGVTQVPLHNNVFITDCGFYSVLHLGEEGELYSWLTVIDPEIKHPEKGRIITYHGNNVELVLLQELHEVLILQTNAYRNSSEPNFPEIMSREFPIPVMEADFIKIIEGF